MAVSRHVIYIPMYIRIMSCHVMSCYVTMRCHAHVTLLPERELNIGGNSHHTYAITRLDSS